jgi:multisubunit Na+/H+ antiporter MnhB subunit
MRTTIVTTFLILTLSSFLVLMVTHPGDEPASATDYYLANYEEDTGAGNAVAAIYLNYRVYDTFFEALLLLVAIVGIIHFFRLRPKPQQETQPKEEHR